MKSQHSSAPVCQLQPQLRAVTATGTGTQQSAPKPHQTQIPGTNDTIRTAPAAKLTRGGWGARSPSPREAPRCPGSSRRTPGTAAPASAASGGSSCPEPAPGPAAAAAGAGSAAAPAAPPIPLRREGKNRVTAELQPCPGPANPPGDTATARVT